MSIQVEELPPCAAWSEVRQWRHRVRGELLQRRMELSPDARRLLGKRACALLVETVDLRAFEVLGIYWAIRGEFDVRAIAKEHLARGGRVALPVVVEKSAPIEYWIWHPGIPMTTGIWNIPIPAERTVVVPGAVIAPLVGFDSSGLRLGYGGGYFDRTLASTVPRPYAIGLGYASSALQTIYPQPHDIPMDLIVTDESVCRGGVCRS